MTTYVTSYVTTVTVDSDSATFEIGSTVVVTSTISSSTNSSTTAFIASKTSSPSGRSSIATSTTSMILATPVPVSSHESSGPSSGQIVGIILGSVIGGCLLICLILFLFCWRRRSKRSDKDGSYLEEKPFSRASMRRSFRVLGTNRPPQTGAEESQDTAPSDSNRPETRNADSLAVNPTPIRQPSRSKSKKKAVLPISAPVLTNRPSIQGSLHQRFFSEPPNAPLRTEITNQHISDATTIRTSANPPTPITPPLRVLPPYSPTASQATPFGEESDYQFEATPSVSASTAVEAPEQPIDVASEQSRPAGHSIEAGIKRSISRAMAHIPMTAKHDSDNTAMASQSTAAYPPTAFKSKNTPKSHISGSLKQGTGPSGDTSSRQVNPSPNQKLSAPPFLEIPDRESSLRDFGAEARRELSLPSRSQLTLQSESQGDLRPPPLALKKHGKRSHSSIRKFTYPTIPKSASAETLNPTTPEVNSQLKRSKTRHDKLSMEDVARYASRPLPTVGKSDTTFGSTSSSTLAVRETSVPSRLRLPSINQERLQIFPPSYYMEPEAIFTPDRTSTGDIILHVHL